MTESPPSQVTQLLVNWGNGSQQSLEALIPLVYDELRRQARRYLRRERPDHTLQSTALVHEAYVRLVDQRQVNWHNRSQFFGVAAQLMRRILVDHARGRAAVKRGAGVTKLAIAEEVAALEMRNVDLIALDTSLRELEKMDPQQSRIVELRFFSGLSIEDTAEALGISTATVKRDWALAKAWLYREISGGTAIEA
ncbi:MAG: sigma-70 family RNA polymerase sigma factor [Acidobacteria bacterium]|nr:sigma-70 family RNA polymerase sigma factor [Acidobacteriota bacterium]